VTGAAQLWAVQRQHRAKRGAYVIFLLAELDPSKDPSMFLSRQVELQRGILEKVTPGSDA